MVREEEEFLEEGVEVVVVVVVVVVAAWDLEFLVVVVVDGVKEGVIKDLKLLKVAAEAVEMGDGAVVGAWVEVVVANVEEGDVGVRLEEDWEFEVVVGLDGVVAGVVVVMVVVERFKGLTPEIRTAGGYMIK